MEKVLENLKDERRVAEESLERRHKENVELRQKLLNSFDRMLDILGKK